LTSAIGLPAAIVNAIEDGAAGTEEAFGNEANMESWSGVSALLADLSECERDA
jgi:hypothetical protein